MTEHNDHTIFGIPPLTFISSILLPRYWLRWIIGNTLLLFAFFVSLQHNGDPQSSDPAVYNASGVHWTFWSYVLIVAFGLGVIFGGAHCRRKTRLYRQYGTPYAERSVAQRVLGLGDAPVVDDVVVEAPQTPLCAPVSHDSVLVVPTVLATGKKRQSEEHEGYDVHDRRRYAHLVD